MISSSLFDVQINGFAGIDFQSMDLSKEQIKLAVYKLAEHQTSKFFLTLITDRIDSLCFKLEKIEQFREEDPEIARAICGYHIEGPWISPKLGFRGAHNHQYMEVPCFKNFQRLQKSANGHIRLITLAPELAGSESFIRELSQQGVQISLGHTDASEKEIDRAYQAGAKFCTHLGNGVPLQMHRHDNVVQRLLAHEGLYAFFIPDGIHLPPYVLKNFFKIKGEDRALFTTDCMSAAGAPTGHYRIGEHIVEVGADRVVRMPGSESFAGSALTPDQGVENIMRWLNLSKEKAEAFFSTKVASLFGINF